MIKRYASPLLYLSPSMVYKQQVVELHDGIVFDFFPLVEEIHSIIWLGEAIVLSQQANPILRKDISFDNLILSITSQIGNLPLFAFSLKGVDLQNKRLFSDVSLEKLS